VILLLLSYLCFGSFRKLGVLRRWGILLLLLPIVSDALHVCRLLCPYRLLMMAFEFRWALAYLLPTLFTIHHKVSRVCLGGLKRDDLGGTFLDVPSALCGFLVTMQGSSGLPAFTPLVPPEFASVCSLPRNRLGCELNELTYRARYVRGEFSRRTIRASCESPCHLSAKRGLLDTCLLRTAPFRSMLLTL
jgi:hypothetical protein